jgi:hypothetical protein
MSNLLILCIPKGLHIHPTVDAEDANAIALAFACETTDIAHAYAFIAEREYNRMLITAKSYRINMLKTRDHLEKAIGDLNSFRELAHPRRTPTEMTLREKLQPWHGPVPKPGPRASTTRCEHDQKFGTVLLNRF